MSEKNNFIHFIYTPFTGLGLHGGYRGDKWLENRIKIFKNYTLKSLLNQGNKNFVHWISWRPEDRDNPQVKELRVYLAIIGYNFAFTFGGCCFWDDKYPNDNLFERLRATLPELDRGIKNNNPDCKYVYMTILASDDMYTEDAIDFIQQTMVGITGITKDLVYKHAVLFQKGYLLNAQTHALAEYNPDTHPPFCSFLFSKDQFLDPDRHFLHIGPYKSHEHVKDFFEMTVENHKRLYCVLVHGENISTVWDIPFKGNSINYLEKNRIFEGLGIENTEPMKIKKRPYLVLRGLFNHLPFNRIIIKVVKKFYN